jgi:hypothetical protein
MHLDRKEGTMKRLAGITDEENWRELSGFIPAPVVSFDEEVPPNMVEVEG